MMIRLKQIGKTWQIALLCLAVAALVHYSAAHVAEFGDALLLLTDGLLLLSLAVLTYRLQLSFSTRKGWLKAAFAYAMLLGGLGGIVFAMQKAVHTQHIPLDFSTIFQLQKDGAIALIALLLLAISLFLLAHRLLWTLVRIPVSQRDRLIGMAAALAVFAAAVFAWSAIIPPLQLVLAGVACVAIFDLYIERSTSSLTWLLFWAVAASAWLALLLFQFNLKEDRDTRLHLAKALAIAPQMTAAQLAKYDYVVFRQDGQVLVVQGHPDGDLRKQVGRFEQGQWREYFSALRADLVYRSAAGKVVVIGKATGGYEKPLSLFSSLFAVLTLLILLLAIINQIFRAISADFELPLCGKPSLRNRIQLSFTASVLGSFLAIALLSAAFFRRSPSPDLQKETQNFLAALLNLYVFLLMVAGAAAIWVANSITKPLEQIGDKLAKIKLGKNEPLVWNSGDELGQLIAEYNRMIAKLEESTELLRQSEREGAWREMARQVAHEIKNPLTPMKLSIQYLQRAYQAQPENAEALLQKVSNTLIEQIDVLSGIASEFSSFAKMPEPQNERLVLNDLVAAVFQLFATQENAAIRFRLELPEEPLFGFADRSQLTRILTNLVKNAIQSIPDGREGAIGLALRKMGDTNLICVSDNGMGIPESVQERVFSPYFTTKSSGTGLGLAMCKGMVEAMNGRIWFETETGKGTRFFVALPTT